MKIEIWHLIDVVDQEPNYRICLFIRELSLQIEPAWLWSSRFNGFWEDVYNYEQVECFNHLKPHLFEDGLVEKDGSTFTYIGEL